METHDKIMLQCDCHGEIVVCEEESEVYANDTDKPRYRQEFSMAFYTQGTYREKPGFWYRLRYALKHIWTGKIYHDFIILDDKKAEELAKFITKNIEKYRPLNND